MFIKKEKKRFPLIFEDEKIPVLVGMTRSFDNPKWFSNAHVHYNETELVFIAKGKATFTINQHLFPVKAGDILVVERGCVHSAISDEQDPSDIISCTITDYKIRNRESNCLLKQKNLIPIQKAGIQEAFVKSCWRELQLYQDQNDPISGTICNMIAGSLVSIYYSMFEDQDQTYDMPEPHFTYDIMSYIYGHYAETITLNRLAEEFHMSAGHISHQFTKVFGISPINYAINLRIDQAKWLLQQSEMSIKEIASEVGYQNIQHFTNIFQKRTGYSPREYKKVYSDQKL